MHHPSGFLFSFFASSRNREEESRLYRGFAVLAEFTGAGCADNKPACPKKQFATQDATQGSTRDRGFPPWAMSHTELRK
jgi:hypothetical protein